MGEVEQLAKVVTVDGFVEGEIEGWVHLIERRGWVP